MMAQRKIVAALRGEAAFHFDAVSGCAHLADAVRTFQAAGDANATRLVPDLTGIDPDDGA